MMRALLDECEVVDLAEPLPNFGELGHEQLTKQRTNADVGEIIAASTDCRPVARIIAVLGMIKRLLHEPGEWLRADVVDLATN